MTESQQHLKTIAPGLLPVIYVHVNGDEAMAGAVAEVLAGDEASVAEVARRYGVRRATLSQTCKRLRMQCAQCCAAYGLDAATMLGMTGGMNGGGLAAELVVVATEDER